jgi:16S rRNA (adenine1518-N6/adenine1519-N6)-dimethyltransferase
VVSSPLPAAALLGPTEIRELAGRLGITPAKRLGQNFMVDGGTASRIAALARLTPSDVVLEVGPGFGSLTLPLLAAAGRVTAVEIDPALAAELPRTIAARVPELAGRLTVAAADAARLTDLPGDPPTALVANLPYNVAVPVVLHLLTLLRSLRRGLVLVQAEVADRMSAPPGSRTYGIPSAKLAWFADARRAGSVPRSAFWPVPRVDSGLVAFTVRDRPGGGGPGGAGPQEAGLDVASPAAASRGGARPAGAGPSSPSGAGESGEAPREAVFAVIDAAFAQRRKTLRAALAGWAGSAAAAETALRAAGIDPGLRGEQLSVAQFAAIARAGLTSRT